MSQAIKYVLFLVSFIFVKPSAFAQEIHIFCSTSKAPLPYATVTNHTHPWVISADRNGAAKLSVSIGDTLSVSYVGYKTAWFRYTGDEVQSVGMILDQEFLPEVTIRNCRRTKEFNYRNSVAANSVKKEDGSINIFDGFVSLKGVSNNVKTAIKLEPAKPNAKLKDFSFWIAKERQAPRSSVLAPLLISFYTVADSSKLPGESISRAPILYFPKKGGKQTIHVDSLNVHIPIDGIYVSFQMVFNKEYEWKLVTKVLNGQWDAVGKDTTMYAYGGTLAGVYAKDFDIAIYDAIKDKWSFPAGLPMANNSLHGTIKCEATIGYCEEE